MNNVPTGNIATLSAKDKIAEAMRRSLQKLPKEAREQVEAMLTPQALAIATGTLIAWAVSHFFGVGEICDVILLGLGIAFMGCGFISGAEELSKFGMTAIGAQTEEDLEKAANHFAKAVMILGITVISAILLKRSGQAVYDRSIQPKVIVQESGAASSFQFQQLKAHLAQQELLKATPVDSALKGCGYFSPRATGTKIDLSHTAPTFARVLVSRGRQFSIKGKDGVYRNLTQVLGSVNGQKGIFEFIVGPEGLTHQRFIPGGRITGIPNQ